MALIEKGGKRLLFDTGSYGDRRVLLDNLGKHGINVDDIDMILLSHLHYDHCINATLFRKAKVLVSKTEMNYALSDEHEKVGDIYVPEPIVRSFRDRVEEVSDGEEVLDGVVTMELPGHTPGSMGLLLDGKVVFAGDALKNAWELINKKPPTPTFGGEVNAIESQKKVREAAEIIVPGHDRAFSFHDDKIEYLYGFDLELYAYLNPFEQQPRKIGIV